MASAVELAVQLGAFLLDFPLGPLFELLGGDRRLAARHLDEFRRLLVGHAARVARDRPDHQKRQPSANDQCHRERPVKRVALGDQKREVGCAH